MPVSGRLRSKIVIYLILSKEIEVLTWLRKYPELRVYSAQLALYNPAAFSPLKQPPDDAGGNRGERHPDGRGWMEED